MARAYFHGGYLYIAHQGRVDRFDPRDRFLGRGSRRATWPREGDTRLYRARIDNGLHDTYWVSVKQPLDPVKEGARVQALLDKKFRPARTTMPGVTFGGRRAGYQQMEDLSRNAQEARRSENADIVRLMRRCAAQDALNARAVAVGRALGYLE